MMEQKLARNADRSNQIDVIDGETIVALSSGGLPSAVAIVRISGPQAGRIATDLGGSLPAPRSAHLCALRRPGDGALLDRGLSLWFPGPNSFTGEDMVELHLHGGPAVVKAVIAAVLELDCTRLAEPGEFTRRALLNGKLDLTEVEGIADLIAAETEGQREQAVHRVSGEVRQLLTDWRTRLIHARAMIEAELDFADEEDIPDSAGEQIWTDLSDLTSEMIHHLDRGKSGERLRSGVQVALLGRPNAGKSRLLNRLAQRDVAIVTEEAGTTRDVLEVHLDLQGFPVTVLDTAGLRLATGPIEKEGISRAVARAKDADLVLWLWDGAIDSDAEPDAAVSKLPSIWTVENKTDRSGHVAKFDSDTKSFAISAETGDGLGRLIEQLAEFAAERCGAGRDGIINRERHRVLLSQSLEMIEAALHDRRKPREMVAEDLRGAADALGRLSGSIGVEDLLDVIFSQFCVGK